MIERRGSPKGPELIDGFKTCPICGTQITQVPNGYECALCDWKAVVNPVKAGLIAKVWRSLDNNKRIIGLVMMGAGKIVSAFGALPIGEGLFYLGSAVGAIGIAHAEVKKHQENKESGKDDIWTLILNFILTLLKRR